MVYSKTRFFTSWMNSSVESRDTCFFVNYKRGLTLPKTELDSMSKRKLTTKFDEEPFCFHSFLFKGKYYSLGPLTQRTVYAILFSVLLTSVLPSPGDISNL